MARHTKARQKIGLPSTQNRCVFYNLYLYIKESQCNILIIVLFIFRKESWRINLSAASIFVMHRDFVLRTKQGFPTDRLQLGSRTKEPRSFVEMGILDYGAIIHNIKVRYVFIESEAATTRPVNLTAAGECCVRQAQLVNL
jgi:hypothetical protein